MKLFGKTFTAALMLALALAGETALAAVSASADRQQVAMGDSLRLTITATDGEEVSEADLRPLQANFEILQRSTSSNRRYENGKYSHTKQLLLDISPLKEGLLTIPPMRVGKAATNRVQIMVQATPDMKTGDQPLVFEAEVDRDSVYVQGQVLLTLRVMQSIQIEGANVSELKVDNAFVKALEQNSFQRTIDGRPWLVHELRYAIFPEQSGTIEIPAQAFSGRVREGRGRSLFDMRSSGRLLRRSSEAITIKVLPRPDAFTGNTWLPARRLTLEEHWSTPPEQLKAGESATRTIRILGEGLQGAQLPPVTFSTTDGLKYYPDQPQISDREVASGILGTRQDSAALVPTRAGTWSIPEIRIPWWDTQTQQLRYAVLPGRDINVASAAPTTLVDQTPVAGLDTVEAPAATQGNLLLWQALSAISTAGWLLTLLYLWRNRRNPVTPHTRPAENTSEKKAFKHLLDACRTGNARQTREAVIAWAATLSGSGTPGSLAQVAAFAGDEVFSKELDTLDASIYSATAASWSGTALSECARRLRDDLRNSRGRGNSKLLLYPQAT